MTPKNSSMNRRNSRTRTAGSGRRRQTAMKKKLQRATTHGRPETKTRWLIRAGKRRRSLKALSAGAKNLGGLISTSLAERGVNVAVHYNSDASEADADRTVAAVEAAGVKAIKVQGDLTVPANVERLFATAA